MMFLLMQSAFANTTNHIVFDSPDLSINFVQNSENIQLEALKS